MKYSVMVHAIGEDDEAAFVGITSVWADTQNDARRFAVEELWDERLTSAGCRAVAAVIGCVS